MSLTGTERGRNSGNRVMLPAIFLKCLSVRRRAVERSKPFPLGRMVTGKKE